MISTEEILERLSEFPNKKVRKHLKRYQKQHPNCSADVTVEYLFTSFCDQQMKEAIAICGYKTDEIALGKDRRMRFVLAKNGVYHEALLTDPDWEIRLQMVLHRYALDRFANDPHFQVKGAAVGEIKKMLTEIYQNDKDHFEEEAKAIGLDVPALMVHYNPDVRRIFINLGYKLEFFVARCDECCSSLYKLDAGTLDKMVKHHHESVRMKALDLMNAAHTSYWDLLCKDKSPMIRAEVARRGYHLGVLLYDKDDSVRKVAECWIKDACYAVSRGTPRNWMDCHFDRFYHLFDGHKERIQGFVDQFVFRKVEEKCLHYLFDKDTSCPNRICAYNNNGDCRYKRVFDIPPQRKKINTDVFCESMIRIPKN